MPAAYAALSRRDTISKKIDIFWRIMLKEGDKAPVFTAKDQDGNDVRLVDFKGKRLVLFFYPKDDTPG